MKSVFLILLFQFILFGCKSKDSEFHFRNGDLVFQTSLSDQSKAIQIATKSEYSHCGIVYKKGEDIFVFEAVQPVKLTPLKKWIERGKRRHFVVKRLKNEGLLDNRDNLERLRTEGEKFLGKDYDLTFEWSDDRIYCSELIYKVFDRALDVKLGELQPLKDFDLSNPIVNKKMKERYGKDIPLREKVISPHSIFESDKLIKVYEE